MIKRFDRPILRNLQAEIEGELAALCKRHGLKVEFSGGRFDSLMWRPKLEITLVNKDGTDLSAKQQFEEYAAMYGLKAADFGREITLRGTRYAIVGINPRKHKYPIEIEQVGNPANKRICTADAVRNSGPKPALSRDLFAKFLDLASKLSPENLTCDGELPVAVWKRKQKELKLQWYNLEIEAGRTVSESDVWEMAASRLHDAQVDPE